MTQREISGQIWRKRDAFERADLIAFGRTAGLKPARIEALLEAVTSAVARWPEFAEEAGVSDEHVNAVAAGLRHQTLV